MEFEIIEVNGTLKKVSTQGGSTMSATTTKRPSVTENITVLQIGDFGVRVDEKNWYNTNEPLKPTAFAVNQSYKVSLSVAKSGKKYINEIIGVADPAPATSASVETATKAQAPTSADDPVKQAEAALAKAKADAEAKVKAEAQAAAAKPSTSVGAKTTPSKDNQIAVLSIMKEAYGQAANQWATGVSEFLANGDKIFDHLYAKYQEKTK